MAKINGNHCSENIRTVKELILDEQKLVTYLTLSKDLCIHVNEAKTILKKVVDEIKESNPSVGLSVTFLISGLTSNNAGLTTVCPEPELGTRMSTFKTIFYTHIYSVCKGSGIDNAALMCADRFEDILLCAGLIKGSSCIKRSSDEIGTLKSNSQKTLDEVKTILPLKKEVKEKTSDVTLNHKLNNVVLVHGTKSEPLIKPEIISPKKDLAGTSNSKHIAKNEMKHSKGIAGFFTKSNSAPSAKSAKATTETVKKTEGPTKIKNDMKPEIKQEESMEIVEEIPAQNIKEEAASGNKTKCKKNSSLSQIKKNAKVDKKRKRVLHVSDSESDDNDPFADEKPANNDSDDEIPPTPTMSTIKITSGILNPKKRRKMVDKTYTDEEGYILTRKEEVYESCSEEEVEIKTEPVQVKSEKENVENTSNVKIEVSPKEKKAKNSKKKVSPPQKGKQTNIMNFFKKI